MITENSIALVTGANRGIGKAIVDTLIAKGASKVYAAVRNPASAESLVEQHGDRVVALELDLNRPETITAAAKAATDVQILVNNAGVLRTATSVADDALGALQFEMEVNVYGLIRMARAFAPILKANGGGAIVQLNSVASLKNFAELSTYSASKAAAYSLTQGLRTSLKEQGTQVVSVHPGPIATDMATTAGIDEIAEPASLVGDAIVDALENDHFHAFPDTMAKQFGEAYAGFAENVIEAELEEG